MNQTPRKIRWLIAHEPQHLFVRTAKAFSDELNKHCAGELEVEILTYSDYKKIYGEISDLEILDAGSTDADVNKGIDAFWKALFDSQVEMSQIQVGVVGMLHPDFHALDLPFMFDDHDHVSEVLEGPLGQQMCATLGQKSGVTGLGFTYSGGYRVIGSDQPIASIEDLEGLRVVTQNNLTLGTTIESMGGKAITISPRLWGKQDVLNNGADAVETTYLRFHGKHVLKTQHSMFMTTILISNKFWETLTEQQQVAFRTAALVASRMEREWSVADGEKFEQDAVENGITIVDISEEDRLKLKKKSQLTYFKCKGLFTPGLVANMRTRH